jgi:hypothetical protein
MIMRIAEAVILGAGATMAIDLWGLFLKKAFGVRSLDYCLLGRWVLHMPEGRFAHDGIGKSPAKRGECPVGWATHYSIGSGFAFLFLLLAEDRWLAQPTLLPALGFGIATVLVPFFTMQPAFGLGIAASRTPNPAAARLKSLGTHSVFGLGLYASANLMNFVVGVRG